MRATKRRAVEEYDDADDESSDDEASNSLVTSFDHLVEVIEGAHRNGVPAEQLVRMMNDLSTAIEQKGGRASAPRPPPPPPPGLDHKHNTGLPAPTPLRLPPLPPSTLPTIPENPIGLTSFLNPPLLRRSQTQLKDNSKPSPMDL